MKMKKWIALLLATLLLAVLPMALAEGLEIEEEPIIEESEEIVLSEDVDNAVQEEDFMLFSNEPVEKGYADFLVEENPSGVPIDAAHFPDEIFRAYVSEKFDKNGNGMLSGKEIDSILKINVSGKEITSLKGIELFPSLKTLKCYGNSLKNLDLSGNPVLEYLDCDDNNLTGLDLSNNTELTSLSCGGNELASLDVRKNPALEYLDCGCNQLKTLDLSKNAALWKLCCNANQLTNLDTSKNPDLVAIYCHENQLKSLNVARNGSLSVLYCISNRIESIDLTGCGGALERLLLSDPLFGISEDGICGMNTDEDAEEYYSLWFDSSATLTFEGRASIATSKITIKDKTWTGKALKPAPVVKFNGATLVKGVDYSVSYTDNTKVGLAYASIQGIGDYFGSVELTFTIKPKGTTISKLTGGKKKITVKWNKQAKQVTGYQIQYATKKDFSNAKKVTVKGAKTTKATIKKLKAKKTYYVRIRTYKKCAVFWNAYSSWSKAKKIKTK